MLAQCASEIEVLGFSPSAVRLLNKGYPSVILLLKDLETSLNQMAGYGWRLKTSGATVAMWSTVIFLRVPK